MVLRRDVTAREVLAAVASREPGAAAFWASMARGAGVSMDGRLAGVVKRRAENARIDPALRPAPLVDPFRKPVVVSRSEPSPLTLAQIEHLRSFGDGAWSDAQIVMAVAWREAAPATDRPLIDRMLEPSAAAWERKRSEHSAAVKAATTAPSAQSFFGGGPSGWLTADGAAMVEVLAEELAREPGLAGMTRAELDVRARVMLDDAIREADASSVR
jgi:hypothetical protein